MKSIRVRFNEDDYDGLEELSRSTSDSVENILSKGVALYRLLKFYESEGKHLAVIDDDWEVFARLNVEGITNEQQIPLPYQESSSGKPANR